MPRAAAIFIVLLNVMGTHAMFKAQMRALNQRTGSESPAQNPVRYACAYQHCSVQDRPGWNRIATSTDRDHVTLYGIGDPCKSFNDRTGIILHANLRCPGTWVVKFDDNTTQVVYPQNLAPQPHLFICNCCRDDLHVSGFVLPMGVQRKYKLSIPECLICSS